MWRFVAYVLVAFLAPIASLEAQAPTAVPSVSAALRQKLVAEQEFWSELHTQRTRALDFLDPIPDSASLRRRCERLLEDADATAQAAALAARDETTAAATWNELSRRFGQHIVGMAKIQMKLTKLERPPQATPDPQRTPMPESAVLARLAWMESRPQTAAAWDALYQLATRDAAGLEQAEALATKLESARQRRASIAATARGEDLDEQRQAAQAELQAVMDEVVATAPTTRAAGKPAPTATPAHDISGLRSYLHSTRESIKLQGELTRDLAAD